MRKHVDEVLAWLDHEVAHPSRNWQGLCQQSARSAWGLAPFGASAAIAWTRIPDKYKHYTAAKDVPAGAICYAPNLGKYGHAWISAGNGYGYSTDVKQRGHIDKCPVAITQWTHDTKVHWASGTPFGPLPLGK